MSKAFTKTPDALSLDSELSDGAFRAYVILAACARQFSSDTFEMTGEQLGTLLGRGRKRADLRIAELVERGLVVVEGNRGRGRPNLITVLDPQDVVLAGLHIKRAGSETTQPGLVENDQAGLVENDTAIEEGREVRDEQRRRGEPLPSPVDNGGALRRPRPPEASECGQHRGQPAHNCGPCRSERIASTGPPF